MNEPCLNPWPVFTGVRLNKPVAEYFYVADKAVYMR